MYWCCCAVPSCSVPSCVVLRAQGAGSGTLLLRGFVRGGGLSANGLITIPGAGDFQISKIEGPKDPYLAARGHRRGDLEMDDAGADLPVLAEPDPGGLAGALVLRSRAP